MQNDGHDRIVAFQVVQGVLQFMEHDGVDGIQLIRTVQADCGDGTVKRKLDGFVSHDRYKIYPVKMRWIIDMSAAFSRNFYSPASDMTVDGFGANPLGPKPW